MRDYRYHPVFGILTDPMDIAIFDRQEAVAEQERLYLESLYAAEEEAYWKAMEEAMYEAQWNEYWMSLLEENEIITEST